MKASNYISGTLTSDIESPSAKLQKTLTLPLPSLLVPPPYTKRGRPESPPAISKTVAPMNVKFCRVLEKSLNVLEMLKLFT